MELGLIPIVNEVVEQTMKYFYSFIMLMTIFCGITAPALPSRAGFLDFTDTITDNIKRAKNFKKEMLGTDEKEGKLVTTGKEINDALDSPRVVSSQYLIIAFFMCIVGVAGALLIWMITRR